MSTTDAAHQEELIALKALYDKVGLRGYWDIGRTASRPAPIAPKLWRWSDIYPALQRASQIVRIGEEAFRRANGMVTGSRTLNAGFQYVGPGETAGAHRHVASALRFVVQGHGGYTTSDGVQMIMEPGDLLTQPNWTWHDHNNFGTEPMIWLDGLDAKLVQYLDANFHENWAEDGTQPVIGSSEDMQQRMTAISVRLRISRPLGGGFPITTNGPIRCGRWRQRRPRGNADPYDGYILEYTDPLSGGHTFVTMSCRIQMLLPGQQTKFHRHTSTTIYHAVSGEGMVRIDKADAVEFAWGAEGHVHCAAMALASALQHVKNRTSDFILGVGLASV